MPIASFSDLAGRTVVVTGGARGLGYTIAEGFAEQGCNVALIDVLDIVEASAEKLAQDHGVKTIGLTADATDAAQVDAAFEAAEQALGTAQHLVTAAGITIWGDSAEVPAEEWRKVIAVCLDGTFFATQSWGRRLLKAEQGGSAILISSMSGRIVNVPQFQASYNTAKAGVDMVAKSLAVEWAPKGIRVNAIAPGYFLSEMTRQFTSKNPDLAKQWEDLTPLGRFGEPEDLKGITGFLASDASSYVTGTSVSIDGGYTAL